ncbi:peroxiredoxin family protein [Amycolatopsis rifamycinica]|uniref:thioredoxin-dependent peroxiredoxin n=1 Tax=Amycolatopsis rifamycinica TaxID=287986 RepID=A0A066TV46_9PSEU|nr:peroxiredoxin family protein [Amycolatopsis rifamycinica]KDN19061.1 peroxiredoxin [Amycolatopsis rifamycinica]
MLEAGSPAPPLELEDTDGRTVRLADHRGHAVLLYFMRSTTCPVCRRHVRALAGDTAFAAAGVRVLIAVPEDRATAAAWRAKDEVPFPVLTGRRGSPHELVGLGRAVFGALQRSGSVLVDAEGVVRHAHSATLPTGGYDRAGIAAAVAALGAPA